MFSDVQARTYTASEDIVTHRKEGRRMGKRGNKSRIIRPEFNTDFDKLLNDFSHNRDISEKSKDFTRPAFYGTSMQQKPIRGEEDASKQQ